MAGTTTPVGGMSRSVSYTGSPGPRFVPPIPPLPRWTLPRRRDHCGGPGTPWPSPQFRSFRAARARSESTAKNALDGSSAEEAWRTRSPSARVSAKGRHGGRSAGYFTYCRQTAFHRTPPLRADAHLWPFPDGTARYSRRATFAAGTQGSSVPCPDAWLPARGALSCWVPRHVGGVVGPLFSITPVSCRMLGYDTRFSAS